MSKQRMVPYLGRYSALQFPATVADPPLFRFDSVHGVEPTTTLTTFQTWLRFIMTK